MTTPVNTAVSPVVNAPVIHRETVGTTKVRAKVRDISEKAIADFAKRNDVLAGSFSTEMTVEKKNRRIGRGTKDVYTVFMNYQKKAPEAPKADAVKA